MGPQLTCAMAFKGQRLGEVNSLGEVSMRSRLSVPPLPTALSILALVIATGGTAWAASSQLVKIADGHNASHLASVGKSGALMTNGASALPRLPFTTGTYIFNGNSPAEVIQPTKSTLAITGIHITNYWGNTVPTFVLIDQYGSTDTTCGT